MGDFHLDIVRNELCKNLDALNNQIAVLKDSLLSESKSTAGDKHETGRATIQLEIEQMSNQLKLKEEMLNELNNLKFDSAKNTVQAGSFVKTNIGEFIHSVAVGKIEGKTCFAISMNSPFAKKAGGLSLGDKFLLNGREIEILDIS